MITYILCSRDQDEDTMSYIAAILIPLSPHSTVHRHRRNAQQSIASLNVRCNDRGGRRTATLARRRSLSAVAVIVIAITADGATGGVRVGMAGPLEWHRILLLLTDRISFAALRRRRPFRPDRLVRSAEASATPMARTSEGRNVSTRQHWTE